MITGKDHQRNTRRIVAAASVLLVLALSLVVANSYARDNNSITQSKNEITSGAPHARPVDSGSIDDPAGLYVQEPNFKDTYADGWQSHWDSWADGVMFRVRWSDIEINPGQYSWYKFDKILNDTSGPDGSNRYLPEGKKAIIGIMFKDSTEDTGDPCRYGVPQYISDSLLIETANDRTAYRIRIKEDGTEENKGKYFNGQRNCHGKTYYYAVDFLGSNVKNAMENVTNAFVERYANHAKVAAFEFGSGNFGEPSPYAYIRDGDSKDEAEKEFVTYDYYYGGLCVRSADSNCYGVKQWARHNLWLARLYQNKLVLEGSDKMAFAIMGHNWPNSQYWSETVRCIAGETPAVCSWGPYTPLDPNIKNIGIKHTGLKPDTLSGGSNNGGTCAWWRELDRANFDSDTWKMMRWANQLGGLKTQWEFNHWFATAEFDNVYGAGNKYPEDPTYYDPSWSKHVRYSMAAALSYGADVVLVYTKDALAAKSELEWASQYVGVKPSQSDTVWIVLREAIEDMDENSAFAKQNLTFAVFDPEDEASLLPAGEGDGVACLVAKCLCGHDVQYEFGIELVQEEDGSSPSANSSYGKVGIDDSLYGATARKAHNGTRIYFDVNGSAMEGADASTISVIYQLNGSHPSLQYKQGDVDVSAEVDSTIESADNPGWYTRIFIAEDPTFNDGDHVYDLVIEGGNDPDWIDSVVVEKGISNPPTPEPTPETTPTLTPTPTATLTPTPTATPVPNFHETMENNSPAAFDDVGTSIAASLSRATERIEGNYAWTCFQTGLISHSPTACWMIENLPSPQQQITLDHYIRSGAGYHGVYFISTPGPGIIAFVIDLSNQLKIICLETCGGFVQENYPGFGMVQ